MTEEGIKLIEPTEALAEEYREFFEEFSDVGARGIDGAGPFNKKASSEAFADLVRRARDQAQGRDLPEGYVPGSTYWLVRGGRVIGTCNLRHRLTDALRDFGGHIGYSVRPSERNKGYATEMLKLALDKARQLGIDRVLLTCDKDNIASARVIQKCCGVLDSEGIDPDDGKITQRYWIELSEEGCGQ